MDFKVYYGSAGADVTDIVVKLFYFEEEQIYLIPSGEFLRQTYLDKEKNSLVHSVIVVIGGTARVFLPNTQVVIDPQQQTATAFDYENMNRELQNLQKSLSITKGNFDIELVEQRMAFRFIRPHHKILEIGGNIGRNSLIIASILAKQDNDKNLVVLESDANSTNILLHNRDINKLNFHVEGSALSKDKLIQRGWNCKKSDVLLPGYQWVQTVDWDTLTGKYDVQFDTLVLDCEGAFFYILEDFPQILDNIKLILIENDFDLKSQKEAVDDILKDHGFVEIYREHLDPAIAAGIPRFRYCKDFFYQVWKKA